MSYTLPAFMQSDQSAYPSSPVTKSSDISSYLDGFSGSSPNTDYAYMQNPLPYTDSNSGMQMNDPTNMWGQNSIGEGQNGWGNFTSFFSGDGLKDSFSLSPGQGGGWGALGEAMSFNSS